MSKKEVSKRCQFKNPELIHDLYDQDRSITAIVGHYNNWELGGLGLNLVSKHKINAIYKPLSNGYFNQLFVDLRRRFGTDLIPMDQVARKMIENKDQLTITVFIADQTPSDTKNAYWLDFFGRDTPVFNGPEKMAKKLDQPVIYCKMNRLKRGYYEVEFIPIMDQSGTSGEMAITKKHTEILETIVRDDPGNWLWSHKRWKHKRPETILQSA